MTIKFPAPRYEQDSPKPRKPLNVARLQKQANALTTNPFVSALSIVPTHDKGVMFSAYKQTCMEALWPEEIFQRAWRVAYDAGHSHGLADVGLEFVELFRAIENNAKGDWEVADILLQGVE